MNNDYGIKATKLINENDVLFQIPRKLMITSETANNDHILEKFSSDDKILQTMPNLLLALHLMEEYAKSDSFWSPYLNILPNEYYTPLYYNFDEMDLLTLSPKTFIDAIYLCRNIYRQYAYFYKKLKSSTIANKLSFKDHYCFRFFRWAISTIMTRQNLIPSTDNSSTMITALIPLWDLCNHSNGKISTDYDKERNEAICYSMKQFNIDEEIKIFYGQRANYELLLYNGFTYTDNDHDHTLIKLGISKNDKLFNLKSQLCTKVGLLNSGYFKLKPKSSQMDNDLLAFLRIFHMNKDELELNLTENNCKELFNEKSEKFDTIDKNILLYLSKRCDLLLNAYKITIDEKVSKTNDKIRVIIMNAIKTLLDGEKSILESHLIE